MPSATAQLMPVVWEGRERERSADPVVLAGPAAADLLGLVDRAEVSAASAAILAPDVPTDRNAHHSKNDVH